MVTVCARVSRMLGAPQSRSAYGRRAVLRLFVRLELFDADQAAGMLTSPHSGFHVHTAVWVSEDDRAFATWLARYCARNPVAVERLMYDRTAKAVTYRSDKAEGPTAGTESADPLEFLARVLVHIPDKGHVTTRYYGWCANRPRCMRGMAATAAAAVPPAFVSAPRKRLRQAECLPVGLFNAFFRNLLVSEPELAKLAQTSTCCAILFAADNDDNSRNNRNRHHCQDHHNSSFLTAQIAGITTQTTISPKQHLSSIDHHLRKHH